ncbi:MAG: CO dehydrogenase/acetyl-CoA synthase subunit delta [Nitrospirota bacterium]
MAFAIPKENYSGSVYTVEIGSGEKMVKVGGENTLPYLSFEGSIPNPPVIAIEIQDKSPDDWPETLRTHFSEVGNDPAKWAAFCEKELNAQLIALRLISTHPDYGDSPPSEAAKIVEDVLNAITVPLIILGSEHIEKDAQVLKFVSEAAKGKNCIIGKAQEENYKTVAASAMANNHKIVAMSQLDVNLAKQLNILLMQMGFNKERILTDPMSSALGYGIEYTYSVMERIRIAALFQNDMAMQPPLVCDIGKNVWKAKETIASEETMKEWGSLEERGIAFEITTAMGMIMAGGNLLIMRNPKAIETTKKIIDELTT